MPLISGKMIKKYILGNYVAYKKKIVSIILIGIVFFISNCNKNVITFNITPAVITKDNVNVRKFPGVKNPKSKIITRLNKGEKVKVILKSNKWYLIDFYYLSKGWVKKTYISTNIQSFSNYNSRKDIHLNENNGLTNIYGILFKFIKGGRFRYKEKYWKGTQKSNIIIGDFWISKYEITQKQYRIIMNYNPSYIKGEKIPVHNIDWYNAMDLASRLSKKSGLKIRLPFMREWTYAYSGGTTNQYYWGDSMNRAYCFFSRNSGWLPHPVGSKKPNNWGLYDMAGNVYE